MHSFPDRMRLLAFSMLVSTALGAQSPNSGMLVSTEWLARHLDDPFLVVLQIAHDTMEFRMGHIPGARAVQYAWLTATRDGNGTELPSAAELQRVFEKLGVSDDSHVVIYTGMTGMAPMASRAFFTLDYIGQAHVSLLNGGLAKWQAERRPVSTAEPTIAPGHLTPRPRAVTVDADWVNAHTGRRGVAFIDTRTTVEYLGAGERHGMRSDGHIPGARQLEWEQLFANADSSVFLEPAAIAQLYADRAVPGDTLVTYCHVGYRASMTYFGARLVGLPVRLYDGSYEDWSRRKLPLNKGQAP